MSKHCIKIKALWFDKNIGLFGYYGAILHDGTPVAICSHEKWSLGKNDIRVNDEIYLSLKENEKGFVKINKIVKADATISIEKAKLLLEEVWFKGPELARNQSFDKWIKQVL